MKLSHVLLRTHLYKQNLIYNTEHFFSNNLKIEADDYKKNDSQNDFFYNIYKINKIRQEE